MMMRTASFRGVTPFGIFDKAKEGFSITSASGGRNLLTLVADGSDAVDEFYLLYRQIWGNAKDFNILGASEYAE